MSALDALRIYKARRDAERAVVTHLPPAIRPSSSQAILAEPQWSTALPGATPQAIVIVAHPPDARASALRIVPVSAIPGMPPSPRTETSRAHGEVHARAAAKVLADMGVKPVAPPDPEADALGPALTLEAMLEVVKFYPSPAQLALVRAADGRSVAGIGSRNGQPIDAMYHFGCIDPYPVSEGNRPKLVWLQCGIRAGKTLLSAFALIRSIFGCSMRHVPSPEEVAAGVVADADGMVGIRPGERVKAVIVTPREHQGAQTFGYVRGAFEAYPRLKPYLVKAGAEQLVIRRPCDGVEVIVECVAASPMGTNVRSTWLAGAVFDEAAFHGDEESVVNLKDNLGAASTRLLPGAQIWLPSSPWADTGYFHEEHKKAFARPGGASLAYHSRSVTFNPSLLSPDNQALIGKAFEDDPTNATREYEALPLSSLSDLFFPPDVIAKAVNKARRGTDAQLPYISGWAHHAGTDLGYRKNSAALGIARNETTKVVLVAWEEQMPQPGAPLVPSKVASDFADRLDDYGCRSVMGDIIYQADATADFGDRGIAYLPFVPTNESNTDLFTKFRRLMAEGTCDLPDDPRLLSQIKKVTGKPIAGGRMQVTLPKQGRSHGDLLVAVMLACVQAWEQGKVLPWDPTLDRFLPVLNGDRWDEKMPGDDDYMSDGDDRPRAGAWA